MTKEEINEEACEHCNWAMCSVCENRTCDNTHLATLKCREWRDRRAGYYCGAESREKHIAELEKENNKLESRNDNLVKMYNEVVERQNSFQQSLYKNIEELEKENAELKEQLTKAKEIIENIIRVTWGEGWNYSLDWKVKAEQFLNNEVEK